MSVVMVTGSAGLIGSEAARFFAAFGFDIVGIDNDMRKVFFGEDASTKWNRERLQKELKARYTHADLDLRDRHALEALFARYKGAVSLVIHTAAQPSHDWASRDPYVDFTVNANGTLNALEFTRRYSPDAVFILTSTNKVYGDTPNKLPLIEQELRWEIDRSHTYVDGIREDMSIDQSLHSLFGASKVAADVLVQEFGRYFGMKTACFRGGCLTGPNHSGAELHGFLAYLVKCAVQNSQYTVYGYQGKQVRDNIHAADLISAFYHFYKAPRSGEVYNIGGGRFSNCSMAEAIVLVEEVTGRELSRTYVDQNRLGDHIWWISDNRKFVSHCPEWALTYDVKRIVSELYEANSDRWSKRRPHAC